MIPEVAAQESRSYVRNGSTGQHPVGSHRTVIFHHIPKTGGSSLESVLQRRYGARATFNVDRSRGVHESLFGRLAAADRARVRLIKGHMDFGVHRYVENAFTYVTMLRHPVERVISHYYYVKRNPNHRLFPRIFYDGMTLEDYVESGITLELNNGQVRSLVGPDHLDIGYGQCTREMLDTARSNLSAYFSVVGLTERFDETLLLMRRELGWSAWPFYRRRNVSKVNPGVRGVTAEARAIIEGHNELDLELYHRIADDFELLFADKGLADELARFRAWNRVCGPWLAPYDTIHTLARRLKRFRGSELESSSIERTGVSGAPALDQEPARKSVFRSTPPEV